MKFLSQSREGKGRERERERERESERENERALAGGPGRSEKVWKGAELFSSGPVALSTTPHQAPPQMLRSGPRRSLGKEGLLGIPSVDDVCFLLWVLGPIKV